MADHTKIEWTEATWNPIIGCSLASTGCNRCYAISQAWIRSHHPNPKVATKFAGTVKKSKAGQLLWTGQVNFSEEALLLPLRTKKPTRWFVNSMSDLFHEAVPDEWIDRIFAVMALCPQHTFQVLTKRSDRMRAYMHGFTCDGARRFNVADAALVIGAKLKDSHPGWALHRWKPSVIKGCTQPAIWPLPNVWLGVSVENQAAADERIPDLLATPAAVRWLSCEPLLGPVDLRWIAEPDEEKDGVIDALLGCNWVDGSIYDRGEEFRPARPGHEDRIMRRWVCSPESDILANRKIDWVVVGGESGKDARPMHPDWARSLRDQCEAAGTAFFFKQWGAWQPDVRGSGSTSLVHDAHFGNKGASALPDGSIKFERIPNCQFIGRTSKKAAGRLLDGKLYDAMPQIGGTA